MRIKMATFVSVLFFFGFLLANEHPCLLITRQEAVRIKDNLNKLPLLAKSFAQAKKMVDIALEHPIQVPPPGEAGGYAHERHKQNYREMQAAGVLFQITGDLRYARFVRDMLLEYAKMYPTLGPSPYAHNQAPGKIFHQMLNETVWLVYAVQAYDCIYDWLSPQDRQTIESNVFRLMAQWFMIRNAKEFDRIHNHGTWAVASVGMLGLVLGDSDYVQKALYGTHKDGSSGFFKQLDLLFSPDGYYMEGPYYIRYALRPFFLFAEALARNRPNLNIFAYRDSILKKAYYAAIETTFPDGVFPPINDASRSMNVESIGVVIANDITYNRCGHDPRLLGMAKLQGRVLMDGSGLVVAQNFGDGKSVKIPRWKSIEFTDGHDGKQGGLGILRRSDNENQVMLLMKYGVHGKGHGHFDLLHFIYYDQGHMVIPDYGFARWINIEPKFGGRYLPENTTYAKQTIAHNTVVVDLQSQSNGNRKQADKVHGLRHFFDAANPDLQVMSAKANTQYVGVQMQRTMFLLKDSTFRYPVIIDLYLLQSGKEHVYDFPLHYNGYLMHTNVPYIADDSVQFPLGRNYGYQHLWKEAQGKIDSVFQFTWLDAHRFYSVTMAAHSGARVFFTRIGAHDPHFNLRPEPAVVYRLKGKNCLFASVIEPHGFFNEASETSLNPYSQIKSVQIIGFNKRGSVIEIQNKNGKRWLVMVNNGKASPTAKHRLRFGKTLYEWTGNFKVVSF